MISTAHKNHHISQKVQKIKFKKFWIIFGTILFFTFSTIAQDGSGSRIGNFDDMLLRLKVVMIQSCPVLTLMTMCWMKAYKLRHRTEGGSNRSEGDCQRNEGDIRQDAKCNTNLPGGTTKLGIQERDQQEEGKN